MLRLASTVGRLYPVLMCLAGTSFVVTPALGAQRLAELPVLGYVRVVTRDEPPRVIEGKVAYADAEQLRVRRTRDSVELVFPVHDLRLVSLMDETSIRRRRGSLLGAAIGAGAGTLIAYLWSRRAIEGQERPAFALIGMITIPTSIMVGMLTMTRDEQLPIRWTTYHRAPDTPRTLLP